MEKRKVKSSVRISQKRLNAHVQKIVNWHFSPDTGCPFWIDWAKKAGWDPKRSVHEFKDLERFGFFDDKWLRGGPIRRWIPKAFANDPVSVFETGGTTGIPKSRININDFRIDYEMFSETLPDKHFPFGCDWLMLGPSGPRRLRLAVEHLAQIRGGICFCVDLDPRWVIKLIKKGAKDELLAYQKHVIDQAMTLLSTHQKINCLFTTPKLLEALANRLQEEGQSIKKIGIKGIFAGGTEFTPQWYRFAVEELLDGVFLTPTYGNTLMGLAPSKPFDPADNYKITYHAPQPRAVIQVVDFDNPERIVDYGESGRILLTTLTKEFFMPRLLERDEGVREPPCQPFSWDGVSGLGPYRAFEQNVTVGVY